MAARHPEVEGAGQVCGRVGRWVQAVWRARRLSQMLDESCRWSLCSLNLLSPDPTPSRTRVF